MDNVILAVVAVVALFVLLALGSSGIERFWGGLVCVPMINSSGGYVMRENVGGQWMCPQGTRDTGCTWGDGEHEKHQCRQPPPGGWPIKDEAQYAQYKADLLSSVSSIVSKEEGA
jgi:hypothetical protein